MKKKLLATLLAIVMVFTTMPVGVLADGKAPKNNVPITAPRFTDMPNDWSKQALEEALANNLLIGHAGKIMADKPLTRAEIATILGRAFKTNLLGDVSKFHDINSSDWYYDEMQKAVGMGIMIGHAGELYPNENITREAAFTILARALQLADNEMATGLYNDEAQISPWAKSSIWALTKAGYLGGHEGRLRPQDLITRAEFAKIMNNLVREYIDEPGMYTKVAEGNIMINTPDVKLSNLIVKGDLILADGIGEGTVTLSSIHIKGRLIVRGGGVSSVILKGSTQVPEAYVAKGAGNVRIAVESGANIKALTVAEGEKEVILEGNIKNVNIKSDKTPIVLKKATIEYMNIFSNEASLAVNEGSKVDNLYLLGEKGKTTVDGELGAVAVINSATDATISLSAKAKIGSIITDASKTTLISEGSLKKLSATENAKEATIVMGDKAIISKLITASKENIKITTIAIKEAETQLLNAKTDGEKAIADMALTEAKKGQEKIIVALSKKMEEKTVKVPVFAEGMPVGETPIVVVPPVNTNTDDESAVGSSQRASLKDASGNEISLIVVPNAGDTLTYNLSVNQLVDGKEVNYSIEEADDDNILTYDGGLGKITKAEPNVTLEFTIIPNGIDEDAKTATLTISFSGDYGRISDKVVTINLERGISQDALDVDAAKSLIETAAIEGKLTISVAQGENLLDWINNLVGMNTHGVDISLESSNSAIDDTGVIVPADTETVGDIVIIITKGDAATRITLEVIVPAN